MSDSKNFMTVIELQRVCKRLSLSTEGSKPELIERICDHTSVEPPVQIGFNDSPSSDVSRFSYSRMKIIPNVGAGVCDESIQTSKEKSMNENLDKPICSTKFTQTSKEPKIFSRVRFSSCFLNFGFVLLAIFVLIGILGGCISFYQQFDRGFEIIEVPVKRSWFDNYMN